MTAAAIDDTVDPASDGQRCPVCAHDLGAHNAISARFCRATESQGLADKRRCICSSTSAASY